MPLSHRSLHRLDAVGQSGTLHFEAQASSQGRISAIYAGSSLPRKLICNIQILLDLDNVDTTWPTQLRRM